MNKNDYLCMSQAEYLDMLEDMLDDAMLDLHDAWILNAPPEYIKVCQRRIEELRKRIMVVWHNKSAH